MKRIVFAVLFLVLVLSSCSAKKEKAKMIFADIGKADSSLIVSEGQAVLIDTGEEEDTKDVLSMLEKGGVEKIDCLILSHFDKDHIGGVTAVAEKYKITEAYITSIKGDTKLYEEAIASLEANGTVIHDSPTEKDTLTSAFSLGNVAFTVYYPKETSYPEKEDNNASLIVLAEVDSRRILFCGDAMELRLQEFISQNTKKIDVIKAPYHGKYLANYEDFIKNCGFEDAVITSSNKNPEDQETLDTFKKYSVESHLTKNGTVTLTVSDGVIAFQ